MSGLRIWALWAVFLGLSLLLHLTGAIGFMALIPGERAPAAGQQTASTVNSLQEILGAPQTVLATATETIEIEPSAEAETAEQTIETTAAEALEIQATKETDLVANAPSISPITPVQDFEAKPVEALGPIAAEDVKPQEIKPLQKLEPQKNIAKKKPEKKIQHKKTESKTSAPPLRKGNSTRNTAGQRSSGASGARTANLGAIKSYGVRVRSQIASRKPGQIGRGRVLISLGISKIGNLRYVRILKSSGNTKIDRAVLRAVRRAAPFPRPPANASLTQLRFTISFTFR